MQKQPDEGNEKPEMKYPYEFDETLRKQASIYHRITIFFSVMNTELLVNLLLFLFLTAGWSVALRSYSDSTSGYWYVSTAVYAAIFVFVVWSVVLAAQLWFRTYLARVTRRAFPARGFIAARLSSLVRAEITGVLLVLLLYYLIRTFALWWVIASILVAIYMVVMLFLFSPEVLMRREEKVPAEAPQSVKDRYSHLLDASGVKDRQIALSLFDFPSEASAFSVGIGRKRCIALSEKMMSSLHQSEIEVILAHELAHHINRDSVRKVVLDILLVTLILFILAQILPFSVGLFGISSTHDTANLPLMLLIINILGIAMSPILNQYSRQREFAADEYAISLTKDKTAFVSCQKRLADLELAPYETTTIERLLFASHPSVKERISLIEDRPSEK